MRVIECVPNVSEGRNVSVIRELAATVRAVPFLHVSSDPDHNRTVFTFGGEPEAVLDAALELAGAVFTRLTLQEHVGVHPRIGVLDVLPFVPVANTEMADCVDLAHRAAREIWDRWAVPSYFYECAGVRPLERVRRDGGEPDTGTGRHPTAGAVAIGARPFLVAWNIWLDTRDLATAKEIAAHIRKLPGAKALGLALESRGVVQVSINSTDFEATPLGEVFAITERLAGELGIPVIGSELIGMIPERAYDPSLRWINWNPSLVLETALHCK